MEQVRFGCEGLVIYKYLVGQQGCHLNLRFFKLKRDDLNSFFVATKPQLTGFPSKNMLT